MTDRRTSDPHPDGIPEDQPEPAPDSPPAAQDDVARIDVEDHAALRGDALDDGAPAGPHDADPRFSGPDGPDDVSVDPRVN